MPDFAGERVTRPATQSIGFVGQAANNKSPDLPLQSVFSTDF